MRLPRIPKEACQQKFTYQMKSDEDDDYTSAGTVDIIISNAVVQMQTVYSGSNNDRQVTGNGNVYLVAGITSPLPTLDKDNLGDRIVYGGKTYVVKELDTYLEPYSNRLYAYKLVVL